MNSRNYTRAVLALAACCAAASGQTVTSSMVGSVVDPADAVVAGAPVTLTNAGTGDGVLSPGAVRSAENHSRARVLSSPDVLRQIE